MEVNYIYHYTSSDAFLSMVHTNKDKSKELVFWASNVYYMNDTKEITILYDELVKVLPKVEKELNLTQDLFSEILFPSDVNRRMDMESNLKRFICDCLFKEVYVISFSDQGDTLPMWSMYGKNGNGLCLVFDANKVNSYLDDLHMVKEVYYNLDRGLAYNYLKEKYRKYYYVKDIKGFLEDVILDLSGRVKSDCYSNEHEFRIIDHVFCENDFNRWNMYIDDSIKHPAERLDIVSEAMVRVQNGLLIPYKEIKIPIDCLSAVIIGPSINQKLQREGLKVLLKGTHIKDENIISSDIPYRPL